MQFHRGLAGAALLMLAAMPAVAQSLEARQMQAKEEAALATETAATNKACGTDLKTQVDWTSFKSEETMAKSLATWCEPGLDAMKDLCESSDMAKQAVAAKVKSLTCAGAAEVSAKLAADGTLTYAFPFSSATNQNKLLIRSYLEKNL